jgi:GNAT superfamily N-acetyltransferase
MSEGMNITRAGFEHAEALSALVNRAYEVERFFVEGDRTSPDDVRAAMAAGTFLMVVGHDGSLAGAVFVELVGDGRASFGMLAVAPSLQGQGLGRKLIHAAEAYAREGGATTMVIKVVNLREDLFPRYVRLGYVRVGEEPYVHRPILRPCHFITMEKAL